MEEIKINLEKDLEGLKREYKEKEKELDKYLSDKKNDYMSEEAEEMKSKLFEIQYNIKIFEKAVEARKRYNTEENRLWWEEFTKEEKEKSETCKMCEYKAKANKYDSLVEKIKEELNKEEIPLTIVGGRRNSKTLNYGIKLGRVQTLEELLDTINKT